MNKIRVKFRKKFENKFHNLDQIENCIQQYVRSARELSEPVKTLKLSLLHTDLGLLNSLVAGSDNKLLVHETHRQELLDRPHSPTLILPASLLEYMHLTRKFTTNATKQYQTFLNRKDKDIHHDYREAQVFRGIGNTHYYNHLQDGPDFLSLYTNELEQRENYYEKNLNSYTLSKVCAEKFFSQKKNQRRVLITST